MRLNHPFIQLPWRFDAGRMAQEIGRLDSGWMAHPDRIDGNTALALISLDGGDNDAFRGAMRPTPHLARCPYLQQVIASFDEVFGRSRLMRLEAGHEVREHVDYHYHWHNHVRIHIPVITTPEVIFHCDDARLHMGAGECWIFDSWRRHRVVNGGPRARIHLVIDTAGSSRFWDTVARAEEAMLAGTRLAARHVGYEPGAQPQILTERYNLQPVLAPGEIESLTHDLIASFASVPGNDVAGAAEYRRIMLAFCRDWRALWYRFGIHRPGWPHYTRLVAQTRRAFPELETPLLVDNRMGLVKSAFIGRVLAVALSPEVYEDFIALPEQAAEAPVAPTLPRRPPAVAPTLPRRPVTEAPPAAATPAARPAPGEDIARNAPCPCGSGQRYKHCHGGGSQ